MHNMLRSLLKRKSLLTNGVKFTTVPWKARINVFVSRVLLLLPVLANANKPVSHRTPLFNHIYLHSFRPSLFLSLFLHNKLSLKDKVLKHMKNVIIIFLSFVVVGSFDWAFILDIDYLNDTVDICSTDHIIKRDIRIFYVFS